MAPLPVSQMRAYSRRLTLTLRIFVTVVGAIACSVSHAIDFDWNGSVDNAWLNPSNWTPAGPPSGGDGNFARFFTGSTRAAAITADIPVVQDILSGNNSTPGIRQIDHSAGTVNLNGWMRLGQDPDGAGALTGAGDGGTYNMSGGTLNAGSYRIGEATGANTTVNLSGNALFNQRDTAPADTGAWARIGEFGNANFNISGNATASFDSRLMIGAGRSSMAVVTQTGGTLEVRRGELVISDTGGRMLSPSRTTSARALCGLLRLVQTRTRAETSPSDNGRIAEAF